MNAAAPIAVVAPSTEERRVDLGADLHAVLRTAGDSRELYVRNDSEEIRSFRPATHLGGVGALRFLAGEVTTAGEPGDGLVCLLAPRTFVRLASPDTDAP